MKVPTKVIIADDHPVVLAGLETYFRRDKFDVVKTAETVDELFSALNFYTADIVVTDYNFGGLSDGIRMLERIRSALPDTRIVVFSRIRQVGAIRQLLSDGVDGFVSKLVGPSFVIAACCAVSRGEKYVDPNTERLLLSVAENSWDSNVKRIKSPENSLSGREREVLRLLAQGLSIREIACRFQRSAKTISAQKCTAMSKLGIRKEIELALYLAKFEKE